MRIFLMSTWTNDFAKEMFYMSVKLHIGVGLFFLRLALKMRKMSTKLTFDDEAEISYNPTIIHVG